MWNSLVVFVILYNVSAVPFRIAFMDPYERFFIWADFVCFIICIHFSLCNSIVLLLLATDLSDFLFRYQTIRTAQDKHEQEKIVRRLLNQTERDSIKKQFNSFDKVRG